MYASFTVSKHSAQQIYELVDKELDFKILPPQEYHVTIYNCENKDDGNEFVNETVLYLGDRISVTPVDIQLLPCSIGYGTAMVITLEKSSDLLQKRDEIVRKRGIESCCRDENSWLPHITLSYHVEQDFDTNKFPTDLLPRNIYISGEVYTSKHDIHNIL